MTVRQLAENLGFKIHTGEKLADERSVCGCFVGDLLSLAMSSVEADNVWVTIQTNVNIVAVASLTDCGCVIVAEGFCPDENTVSAADEQGVIILSGELSAYAIAKKLVEYGI